MRIKNNSVHLGNNTFIRSTGQHVVALLFLCFWESGTPRPLEDTSAVRWMALGEINDFDFAPNVKEYLRMGFAALRQEDKHHAIH